MFENGNDQTIRQLIERIEKVTRQRDGLTFNLAVRVMVNDWARTALTIMDRLTSNEDAWASKYAEAKELGFSDEESEAAADREVANG